MFLVTSSLSANLNRRIALPRGFLAAAFQILTIAVITDVNTADETNFWQRVYKSRWDVDKVFDEFKNKLGETKCWASTANANTC